MTFSKLCFTLLKIVEIKVWNVSEYVSSYLYGPMAQKDGGTLVYVYGGFPIVSIFWPSGGDFIR